MMPCRTCTEQTQHGKHVHDHADGTTLSRQHALDHKTSGLLSALKNLDHEVGAGYLSDVHNGCT